MLAVSALIFMLAVFTSLLQITSTDAFPTEVVAFFGVLFALGTVAQLIILAKTKRKIIRWILPILSLAVVAAVEIVGLYFNLFVNSSYSDNLHIRFIAVDMGVYFVLLGCVAAVLVRKFVYALKHRKRSAN